jgi:hypothetical protein
MNGTTGTRTTLDSTEQPISRDRRAPVGGAQIGALTRTNYADMPEEARGFCWGAFLMPVFWAIGNKTWIGLLVLIPLPILRLPFSIWLGYKGREMAWQNCQWQGVGHFNRVQRRWTQATAALSALAAAGIVIGYIHDPVATAAFLLDTF